MQEIFDFFEFVKENKDFTTDKWMVNISIKDIHENVKKLTDNKYIDAIKKEGLDKIFKFLISGYRGRKIPNDYAKLQINMIRVLLLRYLYEIKKESGTAAGFLFEHFFSAMIEGGDVLADTGKVDVVDANGLNLQLKFIDPSTSMVTRSGYPKEKKEHLERLGYETNTRNPFIYYLNEGVDYLILAIKDAQLIRLISIPENIYWYDIDKLDFDPKEIFTENGKLRVKGRPVILDYATKQKKKNSIYYIGDIDLRNIDNIKDTITSINEHILKMLESLTILSENITTLTTGTGDFDKSLETIKNETTKFSNSSENFINKMTNL